MQKQANDLQKKYDKLEEKFNLLYKEYQQLPEGKKNTIGLKIQNIITQQIKINNQIRVINKKQNEEFNKQKDKNIKRLDKKIKELEKGMTEKIINLLEKGVTTEQIKVTLIQKTNMTLEQIDYYIKQAIQISEEKNQEQTLSTEASNNSGDTINNSELDDAGTTFLESNNQVEGNNSTDHPVVGDNTEASSGELAELLGELLEGL